MPTYYFTYGHNHLDRTGRSLGRFYTPIDAPDCHAARDLMFEVRGPKFCTHYDTAEEAGVERFRLHPASLEEVAILPDLVEDAIDRCINSTRDALNAQIVRINERLGKLERLRGIMRRLPLKLIDKVREYEGNMDLDYLTREEALLAIDCLEAGKWTKSANNGVEGTLDYETHIDGIRVRLWAAGPPESCRVVDEIQIIPAVPEQRVVRKRLICTPVDPSETLPQASIAGVAPEELTESPHF